MKILFVDTWLRGLSFINPVARYFDDDDEICFVHCSSLYGAGVSQEIVSDFPGVIIDTLDYDHNYSKVIDIIRPDIVVFITAHGLVQRYFNFICSRRGLPCFYFMHGARFSESLPSRLKKGVRVIISRLELYGLQAFYMLRDSFGIDKNSFLGCLFFLLEFFCLKNRFNNSPLSKFGMSYKKILINHSADKSYFDKFFGSVQSYEIVGNVSVYENAVTGKLDSSSRDSIVFLSQPDCLDDIRDCGIRSDIEKMRNVTGAALIVRLHPGDMTRGSEYANLLGPCDIDGSKDMSMALSRARLLVGFNSAALLAGNVLGIPTLSYETKSFPSLPYLDGELDFSDAALASHFVSRHKEDKNSYPEHPAKLIVKHVYRAI